MSERLDTSHDLSPLHLPPRHAWKPKYLKYLDASTPSLELPTDDRGFVKADETIDILKDFFVDSYEWLYDPDNTETRVDKHHFHGEAAEFKKMGQEHSSPVPELFRGMPSFVGEMPRLAHNTLHKTFFVAEIPELDPMAEFLGRYQLAKQSFKRVHDAAESTVESYGLKILRERSIRTNPEIAPDLDDTYGRRLLEESFAKHFSAYQKSLIAFQKVEDKEIILPGRVLDFESVTPQLILKIGRVVNKKAVNYQSAFAA